MTHDAAYDIIRPYHSTCAMGWCGLRAPRATSSTSSYLAIANVLGTGVQLNSDDCLDPAHVSGLVAVAAARIVRGGRLVVVEKDRCRPEAQRQRTSYSRPDP
jgi:hypothetical protein